MDRSAEASHRGPVPDLRLMRSNHWSGSTDRRSGRAPGFDAPVLTHRHTSDTGHRCPNRSRWWTDDHRRDSADPGGKAASRARFLMPGNGQISGTVFTARVSPPNRRAGLDRTIKQRHREAIRAIGRDLLRMRSDAGATQAQVSALAGLDRSHYSRIEAGVANAGLEKLVAIAAVLGADVTVRFYPGTGPRLTDRHQARMVEALLRSLSADWRPHVEVPVSRPARGVIDIVLERRADHLLVATEVHSEIRRLEQQLRWAADKAASLDSSELIGSRPMPDVSRLLVLRSTASTRQLAQEFEATFSAAYPARSRSVVSSLRDGAKWPGAGIVWIRIEGDRVELLDGPPRGVTLGR
jgi:transcriptional regulator with XRE-family HTH domain